MKIASSSSLSNNLQHDELWPAIVHELKTPLNAIIGFSEALNDELEGSNNKECLDYIKEISFAANELNEIVHDLLDVSQINSEEFLINLKDKINIKDIIDRSVRLNHDYSLKRNIVIYIEVNKNIAPINLDPKRLKQILTNLISNSLKYSPSNTKISISCQEISPHPLLLNRKPNPEFLEISISDQGFGMSEEEVKIAFEKYQTINNPNSGKVDSFGLGLPIVKRLVELQNGTIKVESKKGSGTKITLRFPY